MNKKIIVIMMVGLNITACSLPYSSSDRTQYLLSQNAPGLVVPPPLTRSNISGFYDLPSVSGHTKVSIVPPAA